MAKLAALPSRAIIAGYKGILDFYLWNEIPCVRKWPTYRPRVPHPSERANQQRFAYINRLWPTLPANIKDVWNAMATGSPYTGKDLFVISYIKGIPPLGF